MFCAKTCRKTASSDRPGAANAKSTDPQAKAGLQVSPIRLAGFSKGLVQESLPWLLRLEQ